MGLFSVLAVAGRPLAPQDLAILLAWDTARVGLAAMQLINRGVVAQKGTELTLAHDLIGEAALRQLPLNQRTRYTAALQPGWRLKRPTISGCCAWLSSTAGLAACRLPILRYGSRAHPTDACWVRTACVS
jgi:hypothetical protein